MPLITTPGFTSKEGYTIEVWDYGNKMPMRIGNQVSEMWHIQILRNVPNAYKPETASSSQEQLLAKLAQQYNVNNYTVDFDNAIKKDVINELMNQFMYYGVEEVLGVKVGERKRLDYTTTKTVKGLKVNFVFKSSTPRTMGAKNIEQAVAQSSEYGTMRRPQRRDPAPRREPAPKIQYGLGSDGLRKLRQLADAINVEANIKVPAGRLQRLIVTIETKHKFAPRLLATAQATTDLIEWFKQHTQQKT